MKRLLVFAIIIAFLALGLYITGGRISQTKSQDLMGTTLTIRIDEPNPHEHLKASLTEVKKLDNLFNKFNEHSEIWMINHFAGVSSIEVSLETLDIIQKAVAASEITQGAFDITLKNYKDIKINPHAQTVMLISKGAQIDLGGIAKGYAVEAARQILRARGVKKSLIDMRSSMAVIGGPWKIGIQDPRNPGQIIGALELQDGQSVSTSGNYEQGKHIVNPKTGAYAEACLGVTIICQNAALADAISTAVFVMGPQKGMELIEGIKKGAQLECLIILNDGKILKTEGFNLL